MDELIRTLLALLPLVVGFSLLPLSRYLNGRLELRLRAQEARAEADRTRLFDAISSRAISGGNDDDSKPVQSRSYFDRLVAINIDNLNAYYGLVKIHADRSFLAVVAAGSIGFIFIITGVAVGLLTSEDQVGLVSAGAGVITEFISTIFFYLYNRTIRELKGYNDSLLTLQNALLAFRVIDDIDEGTAKAAMATQLLEYLMGSGAKGSVEGAARATSVAATLGAGKGGQT